MKRKRFNNLCKELCDRVQYQYNGEHLKGNTLRFFDDRTHRVGSVIKVASYAEAWEMLKPLRESVNMQTQSRY